MAQADRVHSTPPTNTSKSIAGALGAVQLSSSSLIPASRPGASQTLAIDSEPHATPSTCSSGAGHSMTRRLLMNSIVALPIAAAVPTAAPAMLSHPSDDRLVAAAEGLFAAKAAIDQLYREYPYGCGDDGEVDERADCQALFALQDQHIETLITVPATSNAGLRAKASVVRDQDTVRRRLFPGIAVSLANDIVGGARAAIPAMPASAAPKGALDPVFALIAAHREVVATVHAIEAETHRQLDLGIYVETEANDITEAAKAEFDLFIELTEAVPTTLAGVVALVTHLDEINKRDPWKFEDNYATPLIGALATAFNRMAVAS
jgi:hypothetical protein